MAPGQRVEQPVSRTRAPLSYRKIERLYGHAIRNEKSFAQFREALEDIQIPESHRGYRIAWECAEQFYNQYNSLPTYIDMVELVETYNDNSYDPLGDSEFSLLADWLEELYELPDELFEDPLTSKVFEDYLKHYLEDRATDMIRDSVNASGATLGIFDHLENIQKISQRIERVQTEGISPLFPENWLEESPVMELRDTGVSFINTLIGGGDCPGEVYGVLGPTGGGKTMMQLQMASTRAMAAQTEFEINGRVGPLPLCYIFVYEGTEAQMRHRLISCAARIHFDKFKTGNFNGPGVYDNYERDLFRDMFANDQPVPCERERMRVVTQSLNQTLRVVFMSGVDKEHRGRGTGGVEEVRRILEQDLEASRKAYGVDCYPLAVFIDYMGAAVERQSMATNWTDTQKRKALNHWPLHASVEIAVPFNTSVWLLNQLNGVANSFSPDKVPKGTDAKDCKLIKENMDFMLVFGSMNSEKMCLWGVDKARRGDVNLPPEVVKVLGHMHRLQSMSSEYTLDRTSGTIMPRSELRGMFSDHSEDEEVAETAPPIEIDPFANMMAQSRRRNGD